MGKAPRLSAILPLKISVGKDGQFHFSTTTNISAYGAKIILPMALDPGCDLVLEYKKNRAKGVVVWSKPIRRSTRDHEIGIRLIDDGRRFWMAQFDPKAEILSTRGMS